MRVNLGAVTMVPAGSAQRRRAAAVAIAAATPAPVAAPAVAQPSVTRPASPVMPMNTPGMMIALLHRAGRGQVTEVDYKTIEEAPPATDMTSATAPASPVQTATGAAPAERKSLLPLALAALAAYFMG